jgi:hypothetical protein
MSETSAPRPRGATWIPWVGALLGFVFQGSWFSSQFGAVTAKVEEAERRVTTLEQNGSPMVQATRTEVSINSRRLTNLEEAYSAKVSNLFTDNASQNERVRLALDELDNLRRWRLEHVRADGQMEGRIGALDHQLQLLQADHATLMRDAAANPRSKSRP